MCVYVYCMLFFHGPLSGVLVCVDNKAFEQCACVNADCSHCCSAYAVQPRDPCQITKIQHLPAVHFNYDGELQNCSKHLNFWHPVLNEHMQILTFAQKCKYIDTLTCFTYTDLLGSWAHDTAPLEQTWLRTFLKLSTVELYIIRSMAG